jgi:tRNA(Ile)-lysidine synthase
MLPPGARVIAAVSGGPDSVCLFHVLRELAPQEGFTLAGLAHFNHKLRGEASEEDERFVARIAADAGLPFFRQQAPRDRVPGNLEQSLRRSRHAFFAGLLQQDLAGRIALGHTLDDQAETVLFRLLRGSGLAGLAGILPVTADGLVRPLLGVRRSEIEAFLRARRIEWRQDESNFHPAFARNRIRQFLLPQLAREWNPRIAENLAQLADLAHEEERWWAGQAPPLERDREGAVELQAVMLTNLPRALARRVVRQAIRLARGKLEGVEFQHVEQVLALAARVEGEGQVTLPGLAVQRSFGWIRFAKSAAPGQVKAVHVKAPGVYPSPDGKSLIQLEVVERPQAAPSMAGACDTLKVEPNLDLGAEALELRGWRPGDRYRPAGRVRVRKLRDLFQEARVPSWRRPGWPILLRGGRILWVKQFGPAAEVAGGDGPALRIRETQAE